MATRKVSKARKQPGSRRYGKLAGDKVRRSMEEMKAGTLRSGRSGKKVTTREQAIAIGLSEARQMGGKVPKAPRGEAAQRRGKKAGTKRSASTRSAGRTQRAGSSQRAGSGSRTSRAARRDSR